MPVPEEIRKVPRPTNTIVIDNKTEGPKRYAVRSRRCVKYKKNGNPQPLNGPTIGHIYEGKFIPLGENIHCDNNDDEPSSMSYGGAALAYSLGKDCVDDLLQCFDINDVHSIMSIAILRVIRPGVTDCRLNTQYKKSFVKKFFSGAALSKNTVKNLQEKIGKNANKRLGFFASRIARIQKDQHIIIDGTLKQNTSIINDLSQFSYKGRIKGCEDISILYAYVLESHEPLCSQVFPGNSTDANSFCKFVEDNKLEKGILVADKGFPISAIKNVLVENTELHYIQPMKNNSKKIEELKLVDFDDILDFSNRSILYKKVQDENTKKFYYSFQDVHRANKDNTLYVQKKHKDKNFSRDDYLNDRNKFGAIFFESDLDLTPFEVYKLYSKRWELELVFRTYKTSIELETTRNHDDYTVIGAEFINFISTLISTRIINKCMDVQLLQDETFQQLIEELNDVWRKTDYPYNNPKRSDKAWDRSTKAGLDYLEKLGIIEPIFTPSKRKPGRPKKIKDQEKNDQT